MTLRHYRRLQKKEKRAIVILADIEDWKKADLARLFNVTRSRVSQIVNDYYKERKELGFTDWLDVESE